MMGNTTARWEILMMLLHGVLSMIELAQKIIFSPKMVLPFKLRKADTAGWPMMDAAKGLVREM
jgi:hypothetical protein